MEEENELNEQELARTEPASDCGSKPTRPGSGLPGEWDCQNGKWVWVQDIGG